MTNTQFVSSENLPTLSADRLAAAFAHFNRKAHEAKSASACSRAMNLRKRVADEVSRRGLVIRSNRYYTDAITVDATYYMVGRPSDFEPIQ